MWLDDERPEPDDFLRTTTARACIARLDMYHRFGRTVDHLALDHDLGEDESICGNGNQVVLWIEEKVATDDTYIPPRLITVHSDNASARQKMLKGVESIKRLYDRRQAVSEV